MGQVTIWVLPSEIWGRWKRPRLPFLFAAGWRTRRASSSPRPASCTVPVTQPYTHTSSAARGGFPSSTWSKETQHQNGDLENGHSIEGPFLLLQPPASRFLPRAPYPSHWSAVTRLGERPLALSPPPTGFSLCPPSQRLRPPKPPDSPPSAALFPSQQVSVLSCSTSFVGCRYLRALRTFRAVLGDSSVWRLTVQTEDDSVTTSGCRAGCVIWGS